MHEDYVSLKSNAVEEYTLIICTDETDCHGGETKFHFNQGQVMTTKTTVTPHSAVAFRKDMSHEGLEITRGTKAILTLNLWCLPKTSGQQVAIIFPKEGKQQVFMIPVEYICAFDSYFSQWYEFAVGNDESLKTQPVLTCEVEACSAEEFGIVADVLMRRQVGPQLSEQQWSLLQFFMIPAQNVLIPVGDAVAMLALNSADVAPGAAPTHVSWNSDKLVNLYPSLGMAHYAYEQIVKAQDVQALPFWFVFIEGDDLRYGPYGPETDPDENLDSDRSYSLQPIAGFVSHYDNMWFLRAMKHAANNDSPDGFRKWPELDPMNASAALDVEGAPLAEEAKGPFCPNNSSRYVQLEHILPGYDAYDKAQLFDCQLANPDLTPSSILHWLLASSYFDLPLATMIMAGQTPGGDAHQMYVNDEYGQTYVPLDKAKQLSAYLRKIELSTRVKEELVKGNVNVAPFSQVRSELNQHYCNESLYGMLTVAVVPGIVTIRPELLMEE
eukprot:TRINITY_DN12306_c0_g2_i1.p1 TRINITY_DN12306_c0_g2~~TRINITY_DN12306_c0_g2_i1.p1  ORF type:complete len:497 (+),score=118.20 TRINITY_DN12306_c0_g2_i1:1455-2945(+)